MSPLFVSASSWLIVSVDNKKSYQERSLSKSVKKSQFRISLGDSTPPNSDSSYKNYYSKDYRKDEEFVHDDNSYFMLNKDCHSKREVASLTKIMTCYTVLKLIEKLNINKTKEIVTISSTASRVIGTSALLKANDMLSVWDLLHGLMLPSGNDAAHALAEHFGNLLLTSSKPTTSTLFYSGAGKHLSCNHTVFQKDSLLEEEEKLPKEPLSPPIAKSMYQSNKAIFRFIQEMNKNAAKLDMLDSHFDSPHGLPNKNNKATAYDMAKL